MALIPQQLGKRWKKSCKKWFEINNMTSNPESQNECWFGKIKYLRNSELEISIQENVETH